MRFIKSLLRFLPYIICLLFFIAYSTLSIVRHNHYQSFGYDLGINDQTVWRYSTFQKPLTTIDPFPDKTKLYTHVELIYAFISPIYWIWSSRKMLLLVEIACLCSGGLAIFFLARERKLTLFVSIALLIGYLSFYGLQNTVWFDVHSASFGAAFLAWFMYFLYQKNKWGTIIFFILAITAKENIAFITFFIAFVYFYTRKDKMTAWLMISSLAYLFFIFYIYFPHIIHFHYLYQNKEGLLSNLNPFDMFNTPEKLQTEFYTIFSFGFLPLLAPLSLLPAASDLATYYVIGSDLPGAQGLFMHYRVTLAPLLAWAATATIIKYKFLNSKYVATYLLIVASIIQYTLHLPLSYLTKSWFWHEPPSVKNINFIKDNYLPKDASVVAQNNIVPHISHRDKIYSLYPEMKRFNKNSPCGKIECNWFRWYGNPEYLFVDSSEEWDIRHLLENRDDFIAGIHNLEAGKVISVYKRVGTTALYKVNKNPNE